MKTNDATGAAGEPKLLKAAMDCAAQCWIGSEDASAAAGGGAEEVCETFHFRMLVCVC